MARAQSNKIVTFRWSQISQIGGFTWAFVLVLQQVQMVGSEWQSNVKGFYTHKPTPSIDWRWASGGTGWGCQGQRVQSPGSEGRRPWTDLHLLTKPVFSLQNQAKIKLSNTGVLRERAHMQNARQTASYIQCQLSLLTGYCLLFNICVGAQETIHQRLHSDMQKGPKSCLRFKGSIIMVTSGPIPLRQRLSVKFPYLPE